MDDYAAHVAEQAASALDLMRRRRLIDAAAVGVG